MLVIATIHVSLMVLRHHYFRADLEAKCWSHDAALRLHETDSHYSVNYTVCEMSACRFSDIGIAHTPVCVVLCNMH